MREQDAVTKCEVSDLGKNFRRWRRHSKGTQGEQTNIRPSICFVSSTQLTPARVSSHGTNVHAGIPVAS